jgi:hypothetical protein
VPVKLRPNITSDHPRMTEEWILSTDGMTIDRIKPKYTEKNLSSVTLSPQIPYGLPREEFVLSVENSPNNHVSYGITKDYLINKFN